MEKKDYSDLRDFIYSKSGISLSENKESLVSARIGKRLRTLGLNTPREYINILKNETDEAELIQFLDVISTNVTFFYREAAHFKLLSEIIKKWYNGGQKQFKIWCAASSSGEEPYTLAMTCLNAVNNDSKVDIKILGTDISTRILKTASEGIYPELAMKDVPKANLNKYFLKQNIDGAIFYKAAPKIRDIITFKRLNLSVTPYPLKGPIDIVFCRNVMIYFDNPIKTKLVAEVHRILRPEGYLMVGHSESLTGITTGFKVIQPAAYQKK